MSDETPLTEPRLEAIVKSVRDRTVDEDGNPPAVEDVKAVVEEQARSLADAPVQDFVPLLVEHATRDEFSDRGMHVNPDAAEPDQAPALDSDDEGASTDLPMAPPPQGTG